MSDIFQRSMERVWTVEHHQHSPIHTAGMVLDPNKMKESPRTPSCIAICRKTTSRANRC
ncbi:hypothetical protein V7659_24495 [Neobacillus drentensis]|uniref:hypothetical protein n=1 Tax=Neobacillus drentensis TaxID=220684 RepID=UPI003000AECF